MKALLTPRHLVPLVLTVLLAGLFVRLGMWQLDRRADVAETNARLEERILEAPLDTLPAGTDPADLEFRRVHLRGTFRPEDEVLVRSRARRGVNGWHVVTPLVTDDATVLVNRGWVPFDQDTPPVAATPPDGEVTITGVLLRSEEPIGMGPRDATEGRLTTVFRIEVARIDQQVDGTLYPMFVQSLEQVPPQPDGLPDPAPSPSFDGGPHLNYASQWFSFAIIGLVTVAIFTRKRLRSSSPTLGT